MGKVVTFVFCAFFCAVFASCTTQRKNVHTKQNERFDAIIETNGKSFEMQDATSVFDLTRIYSSFNDTELTFEIYDTSVKTDSGTYAIKAKGVLKSKTSTNAQTSVNDSTHCNDVSITDIEIKEDIKETIKTDTKEKTPTNYTRLILYLVVIVALLVAAVNLKNLIEKYY